MFFEHQTENFIHTRCSCGHKREFHKGNISNCDGKLVINTPYCCYGCQKIHHFIEFEENTHQESISPPSTPTPKPPPSATPASLGSLTGQPQPANVFSLVVIVGLIVLAVWWMFSPSQKKERTPIDDCTDQTAAYVMANEFVLQRLKAPSTAQFPTMRSSGVSISHQGSCTHIVSGYVDAQNSFGAMLRTTYTATLQYQRERNSWRLLNIDINQ